MNLALLPNLCALLVFIGAFRPLARRAGPHTNAWFLGWAFLLHHDIVLIINGPSPGRYVWFGLLGTWSLELVGISFLRAAANAPYTVTSLLLSAEMAVPILAQAALAVCGVRKPWLQAFFTLLMLCPGIHIYLDKSARNKRRVRTATGFAVAAVSLVPLAVIDPMLALSIVHCLLFLGSAALYWDHAEHTTPGVFTAVIGLTLWGMVYPLEAAIGRAHLGSPLLAASWQFPSFIVAYGMMLTLIEQHVRHTEALAMHDTLTGLPNRRLFEDRLKQALTLAPTTGTMLACLVIDLDNFKQTNDTMGHAVGDELLQAVATRLSWHIQPGDTLARTGGDEFAVVLPRLQSLEHLRFTVGALMSATSAPALLGNQTIPVSLSIGIALYPEAAADADGLRRSADAAMYDAKRDGGNRFAYAGGPPDEIAHLLAGVPDNLRRMARSRLRAR